MTRSSTEHDVPPAFEIVGMLEEPAGGMGEAAQAPHQDGHVGVVVATARGSHSGDFDQLSPQRPLRIQRRRTKGWRMPENAVYVGRGSRWGNPYVVHDHTPRCGDDLATCPTWSATDRTMAVRLFRHAIDFPLIGGPSVPHPDDIRADLAGRDLACWCPPEDAFGNPVPCHADVLLEIANGSQP